jgi:uncharacterized membrane protein YccC
MSVAMPLDESMSRRARWAAAFSGEGSAWLFVAKSVLAVYLAAWLAMWLQLEQPATSMITVGIVMHPHSGMVLAKSFYRAIGTLAGSAAGLLLMALFPQQRELFLFSLSLWVAVCAGGAMLYRNFMSYGFVLAGYTAAIVALPAVGNPLGVFDSAVMRVSEVMLGIVVAGIISDVVFPERLRAVLRKSAHEQFAQFIDFVRGSASGKIARAEMEQAHLRFVRAAVGLEDLRASVIFEDAEARARSHRMQWLNQRYMAASTSFQSLHHLINRVQRAGSTAVAQALVALYQPLGAALTLESPSAYDPRQLVPRLRDVAARLPGQSAPLRARLPADPRAQLDFDTGAALLQRLVDELHAFAELEGELREGRPANRLRFPGSERVRFHRGNDVAGAAIAVLRTFLTMAALAAFWLASGWPFGSSAMLIATVFCGLFAASPHPITAVRNTLAGYAAGMLAALLSLFWLLPGSDGFVMLVAATLPLLMLGPYLGTRPGLPGVGAGYAIGFVYLLALKNPMTYDPVHSLNDALSQLVGVGLSGVAFVFVPAITGSRWQRARQMRQLREQVVQAATAPLDGLASRFESTSRDLFQQIVEHTRPDSADARHLLAWALSVHECGRALIELRQAAVALHLSIAAERSLLGAVQAVARLYRAPDPARWQLADEAVRLALESCPETDGAASPVRRHLHQLRSALRDDASAMAVYIAKPEEPAHAV